MPKEQPNGKALTKMDAMRQALGKLGDDAKPSDLQEFVKKTFKIDMELNAVSSYKSKLKDETKATGKSGLIKKPSHSAPTEQKAAGKSGIIKKPAPPAPAEEKPEISKMDGVRKALAKLGDDAKPLAIQGFVKKKFDLDMETAVISSYKTSITKKEASKSAIIRRPAPAAPAKATSSEAISLDDIKAVKSLAERIGAENLQQLAEVLA